MMATREEKKEQRKERKEQRKEQRKKKKELRAGADGEEAEEAARQRARLLSKLYLCEDDGLGTYREKRLPAESAADADRLQTARSALHAIVDILESSAEEDWALLGQAAQTLEEQGKAAAEPTAQLKEQPSGPSLATAKPMPDEPSPALSPSTPAVTPPVAPAPARAVPPVSPMPRVVAAPAGPDRPAEASPWAAKGAGSTARTPSDAPAPSPPPPDAVPRPAPARPPSVPPAAAAGGSSPAPPPLGIESTIKAPSPLVRTAPGGDFTGQMRVVPQGPGAYLPFKDAASAEPPKPAVPALDDQNMDLGATVSAELMSPMAQALPFESKATATVPTLTVEQYASLCAERNAKPGELAATLRKYGLADSKAERALDDKWKRTFADQPKLRERWLDMVRQYTSWLESRR